jgi:[acyl-carrier-protein] S-malonyltransferase
MWVSVLLVVVMLLSLGRASDAFVLRRASALTSASVLPRGSMNTRLFSSGSASIVHPTPAPAVSYKVGFMFPGQGAQAVGMGAALAEQLPQAKKLYDVASQILGYNLLEKCTKGPKGGSYCDLRCRLIYCS